MRKDSVETILGVLNDASVRYLVVGGLAVAAHGYLRTTADMDLVLDLDRSNVDRALAALSALGYVPRPPVPLEQFADPQIRECWIAEKGLTVFTLHSPAHPATEVDLFVKTPFDFERSYRSAHRVKLTEQIEATFVSFEDLIAMKKSAGRPQDLADIQNLNLIRKSNHGHG